MFKIGSKVVFRPQFPRNWSAKDGATARVVSIDNEANYISVEWCKDNKKCSTQMNGKYHMSDFKLLITSFDELTNEQATTLPSSSEERKTYPMYEGLLKYFPKALAEVAKVSKIGNDKHNAGEPLHHARGKSGDHGDCIIRHMVDLSEDYGKGIGRDENGVPQVAYIAWRALALAQEWFEKNDNAPMAPNAKEK